MTLSTGLKTEKFHWNQGCQFTSGAFVGRIQDTGKISWTRRKRCYDNILAGRTWRTLKYEGV
jgi:putative transposase